MNKFNLNKIAVLLVALVALTGCVEDDKFDLPNVSTNVVDFPADQKISISAVVGVYHQENPTDTSPFDDRTNVPVTLEYNSDRYMEGYIVSSDEGGNFFKELVLQDAPENPTVAIVVQVDKNPLFTQYEFGRRVFVKLNGLSVAEDNGVIQLGRLSGDEIDRISSTEVLDIIIRTDDVATIVPREVSISDFPAITNTEDNSYQLESQYIRLSDVQFNRNILDLSFASESNDSFDGERLLESCTDDASVILSTSTFSDFKGLNVPDGRGTIDCILTRDFFDDFYTVYINTPEGINFDNPERCDPDFLECEGPSGGGVAIFTEDFEGFGTYATEGWDNINISATSTDWFISSFSGNSYSRISAFSSGNTEADVWLVTPPINMDATTGEELSFDVQANFDNGTNLSAWISTDYSGDPTTANWQILDATIPVGPSSTFGDFETVGPINISCVDGNAVIGFFYEGSDPSATTRYHVDNVEVTGN